MKKANSEKIFTLIFIIVGVILISVTSYKVYNDFFKKEKEENKDIDKIELYGYVLQEDDTELFKSIFKDLSEVLNNKEVDYEEYAKLISKLYIIDFYSLNNKVSSTDIGGLEFIHKDALSNFKINAGDTIYKYIETNINKDRKQDLPNVASIEIIDFSTGEFIINDKTYDSYEISLKWEYDKDLGFQKSTKLTLIKEKHVLYIVKSEKLDDNN